MLQRETEEKFRNQKQLQDAAFIEMREKYDALFES